MKKVLSVLLSVMLFMMMFQGIQIFAAVDNSYAYVLSEQTPNYNDVTATVSEDGAYVSLVTTGDDSWFALDGLNIPSEYKILAIKYAGISTTNFEGNNHYVATNSGLQWGQSGSYSLPNMTADDEWHLKTYDITTEFTGVGSSNITSARIRAGKEKNRESRFAYIGFFKSEADAQAYDAEYCANNTLNKIEPPPRVEVIPNALPAIPEYTFNFDDLEADYDLFGNSFASGNPFRKMWTPKAATPDTKIVVAADKTALFNGFVDITFDERWQGAGEISLALKNNGPLGNFSGFFVRCGEEGSTPFYENDGARPDGSGTCTTGTTGVGFSFRKDNVIEIVVKYIDAATNKLAVKGYVFKDVVDSINNMHTYKVLDDNNGTMKFYADDILFAQVTYFDAKLPINAMYSEKYYSNAKILSADGAVLETIENALISTQNTIAFGARAESFSVDNIKLSAYVAPVEDKTISMEKTTFAPGEEIKINFNNADRSNSDWLCIYAGAESEYGVSGGPVSLQYAYIGGNGTVIFNDLDGTDRTAAQAATEDKTYDDVTKVFYQPNIETLPVGTYHAVMLGGGGWYDVQSNKIVFTVAESAPVEPEYTEYPMATSDEHTSEPSYGIILGTNQYYGVRFNSSAKFNGLKFDQWTPGGGSGSIDYKVSVFKWDTDFETTKAGTAEVAIDCNSTGDGILSVEFGKEIEAGEYLILLEVTAQNDASKPGMHMKAGASLNTEDTTYFEMYANSTLGDVSGTRFAMFNLMAETDAGEVFKALSADTTDPVDPPKPPVTGDSSIYLTVAALVVVSAAGVILYRKKKAAL